MWPKSSLQKQELILNFFSVKRLLTLYQSFLKSFPHPCSLCPFLQSISKCCTENWGRWSRCRGTKFSNIPSKCREKRVFGSRKGQTRTPSPRFPRRRKSDQWIHNWQPPCLHLYIVYIWFDQFWFNNRSSLIFYIIIRIF